MRAAERGTAFRRMGLDGTPILVIGARVYSAGKPARPTPIIAFVTVSLNEEAADLRSLASGVAVADAAVLLVAFVLALAAASCCRCGGWATRPSGSGGGGWTPGSP
ncbi:hypothetical protein ACFQU9_08015 [Actinomadura namibiensis]|uniref:Uncharacterized protein n=1 Tax=Actinomadura namibiensis TaxID=182080 RepID=A0A7W3LX76_ACTNM|nr:hypothetical protein [Actinomadura namibiensis]MBA8955884.1 hypothetical protein [Actinomadura namibiensis]